MHFSHIVMPILALAGISAAALNTTQEFKLVTEVKPGQHRDKSRFNGLLLTGYHSGAGLNDAVLVAGNGSSAYFSGSTPSPVTSSGQLLHNLTFDLGNTFAYSLNLQPENTYVRWYGLGINAGNATYPAAYFANETGLQVALDPTAAAGQDAFGGWWACYWSRGVPQLFLKLKYYNSTVPMNCAEIYLQPKYF